MCIGRADRERTRCRERGRKRELEREGEGKKNTSCSPEILRDPHRSKLEEEEEGGIGNDAGAEGSFGTDSEEPL